jgi:hypothetical protein
MRFAGAHAICRSNVPNPKLTGAKPRGEDVEHAVRSLTEQWRRGWGRPWHRADPPRWHSSGEQFLREPSTTPPSEVTGALRTAWRYPLAQFRGHGIAIGLNLPWRRHFPTPRPLSAFLIPHVSSLERITEDPNKTRASDHVVRGWLGNGRREHRWPCGGVRARGEGESAAVRDSDEPRRKPRADRFSVERPQSSRRLVFDSSFTRNLRYERRWVIGLTRWPHTTDTLRQVCVELGTSKAAHEPATTEARTVWSGWLTNGTKASARVAAAGLTQGNVVCGPNPGFLAQASCPHYFPFLLYFVFPFWIQIQIFELNANIVQI